MLDEVVGALIVGAVVSGGGGGPTEGLMRRRAKAFLQGKPVTIPAYLQTDRQEPRQGRLRLHPQSDDLVWRRWPSLGRNWIELGPPCGRASVSRSHSREVPFLLRGPAWAVAPAPGQTERLLFLDAAVSRVFAPVFDGGLPPAEESTPAPPGLRKLLADSIARLAAPPDQQLAYLRALGTEGLLDELALEFDGAWRPARPRSHELGIGPADISSLDMLDEFLREMSDPERAHLWRPPALGLLEWRRVRALATTLMHLAVPTSEQTRPSGPDPLLSACTLAFVGVPGQIDSRTAEARVLSQAGVDALDLLPAVESIVADVRDADPALSLFGTPAQVAIATRAYLRFWHPGLSDEAVEALTNWFAFGWR